MNVFKWGPWLALAVSGLVLAGQCAVEPHLREKLAVNKRNLEIVTFQRDSAREALEHRVPALDSLIDTLWLRSKLRVDTLTDTLPVPVEVVREIVRDADTTIRACRATVSACERVASLERARADTLANRVKLLERGQPFRFTGYGASDLRGGLYAGVMAQGRVPLLPIEGFARGELRVDSLAFDLRAGVALSF